MTLWIIIVYLLLVLAFGIFCSRLVGRTAEAYFLAGRGIGSFMLLMSIFGTTMTAFALIGSTGKTFEVGIGVYALIASWAGIVHVAIFFLVGIKVWSLGKRYGYITQIHYFRDRYQSDMLALILFPVVVAFVLVYILMGVIGAGRFISNITQIVSYPVGMALVCIVVLSYVFLGGMRATVLANTFQTLVFMVMGVIAFFVITDSLGGPQEATRTLLESPEGSKRMLRAGFVGKWELATYGLVTLSVGMFPHLFQHWLTAKDARSFKLTIIAYPILCMIVWAPCVLIGMWAAGILPHDSTGHNAVLAIMVSRFSGEVLSGLIGAGVLAAIMSSMDSQFLCLSSLFTHDIVARYYQHPLTDRQRVALGRGFVVFIVMLSYLIGYFAPASVFDLGIWCFSGFSGLFPVLIAALYWRRSNKYGAIAGVLSVAALWIYFLPEVMDPGREGEFLLFDLQMMPVTLIVAISSIFVIIGSLVTPKPAPELVERFFPNAEPGITKSAISLGQ